MTMRIQVGSLPRATQPKTITMNPGMFDFLGIRYNRIYYFKMNPEFVILATRIL
jgi:hypothetical protein